MIIDRLHLVNFRNYKDVVVSFREGTNIFLGKNGQGKTNLLEAVHFLSVGSSPRSSHQGDLARWGEHEFRLLAHGREGGLEYTFDAFFNGARLQYRLNGKEIALSRVPGHLPTVFFSPDDLFLLKGPPAARRDYLDRLFFQASPQYRFYLQRYNRVVAQRNNLLKQGLAGHLPSEELAPWDEELVSLGSRIIRERLLSLKKLAVHVGRVHNALSGYVEKVELLYRSSVPLPSAVPTLEEMTEAFTKALQANWPQERARGLTLSGPHRDDLTLLLDGKDLRSFGSQGQQRTAILALKFAEAEFLKDELQKRPLLLLDDVFSELDEIRQGQLRHLFSEVGQVFITSTDATPLPEELRTGAAVFHIEAGQIRPSGSSPGDAGLLEEL